jgi:hypothetical protein
MDHTENDKFNNYFIVMCINCHTNASTESSPSKNTLDKQRESRITTGELKEVVFSLQSDPQVI